MSGGLHLTAPDATPGVSIGVRAQAPVAALPPRMEWIDELETDAKRAKALDRMATVAQLGNDYAQALDAKREELAADPDFASREAKFRQYAQDTLAQKVKGLDNETAKYLFTHGQSIAQTMDIAVRANARKDRRDDAIVTLGNSNNALVVQSADAPNPAAREALLAQVKGNLDEALKTDVLTAAEHKTMVNETLKAADRAMALKLIRGNPGGMAAALGKSDFLPNLDPVMRETLINQANSEVLRRTNLAYTQEARRELAERRATALQSNTIMKDIVDASNTPDGIPDELLAKAKAVVPWHDYQAAVKLKAGGAEIDSKAALARVVPDIDTRDVSKDLSDELLANRISGATYKTLMERNRNALKDDQPQSPYRQGRDYIKTVLDPAAAGVGGNLLGGITAGLRADALMEYDTWADANRDKIKADPRMAVDYATDIGRRYKLAEFSTQTSALGLPRFTSAGRQQFDETALVEAAKETVRRHDAREISDAEYLQQSRLLKQWDAALRALKAAPPPPAQGGGR